jgi:hypothetical protein
METALISAVAAILGSLVGGLSSVGTTWLAQRNTSKGQREALYGEFIQEAARMIGRALESEDGSLNDIVPLLGMLGRMRLVSSQAVIDEAEKVIGTVVTVYDQPALSLRQLRVAANQRTDPLKGFGEACRAELGRA